MSKFMTPKAIANKIKAKGLGKLKFYCQMCEKQCRDENGFKNHCLSEGHHQQMSIFAQNPDKFMDNFSTDFEDGFIEILSRRFINKSVNANVVFNEYIQDKAHIHLNSTIWNTLTAFVLYLGRKGKVKVDESERGWFIKYIDRDPAAMARQAARDKKEKHAMDDQERLGKEMRRQAAEAKRLEQERTGGVALLQGTELTRNHTTDDGTIKRVVSVTISAASSSASSAIAKGNGKQRKRKLVVVSAAADNESSNVETVDEVAIGAITDVLGAGSQSAEPKRAKKDSQTWFHVGLVVKIVSKGVHDGKYHKQKGVVVKVEAETKSAKVDLTMLNASSQDTHSDERRKKGKKVRVWVTEREVETVLPAIGGAVMLLAGAHKHESGRLRSIDVNKYCAAVEVGVAGGAGVVMLPNVQYEHLCKVVPLVDY